MAVDDHGLEALKKSAEQVTPGNKSDYYLKTRNATLETLLSASFISGQVESPNNKTYTLDLYSIEARIIDSITLKTVSGTLTAAVRIDGVAITGLSSISVSSTETTALATALNNMAIGQTLDLVVSGITSPVDLVFTLKYRRV